MGKRFRDAAQTAGAGGVSAWVVCLSCCPVVRAPVRPGSEVEVDDLDPMVGAKRGSEFLEYRSELAALDQELDSQRSEFAAIDGVNAVQRDQPGPGWEAGATMAVEVRGH